MSYQLKFPHIAVLNKCLTDKTTTTNDIEAEVEPANQPMGQFL